MNDKEKAAYNFFKLAGLGIKLANTVNELVGGKPKPMLAVHYAIMTGFRETQKENPDFEILFRLLAMIESASKKPLQNEIPKQVSDTSN